MTGQEAYEAEVREWPYDWRGWPRATWAQLGDFARASWNKYPTPRERPPYCRKDRKP